MADPLSISASITAVLQLSGKLIEYLNSVKGASEDRQRLLNEITSISGLLYFLKDRAAQSQSGDSWSSTLKSLSRPKGALEQFKFALQRLTLKLAPVVGWWNAGNAVAWPFQKVEVKEILASIERYKSLFSLALQNDHMCVSQLYSFSGHQYSFCTVDYLKASEVMLGACTTKLINLVSGLPSYRSAN
jgi:hypothetical protein